jgi:predicted RND superfamily exporter protein
MSTSKKETPASPDSTKGSLFQWWIRLVLRHRLLTTLALVALSATFAVQAGTRLVVDTSAEALLADDSEASRALVQLRETFGDDRYILVLAGGNVFTNEYLERLKALHTDIEAISLAMHSKAQAPAASAAHGFDPSADDWDQETAGAAIDQVVSLINVREVKWTEGTLRVGDFVEELPLTPAQLEELRTAALRDPVKVGRIIGEKGAHSVVIVRTSDLSEAEQTAVYERIGELCKRHRKDDFTLHLGGYPALLAAINTTLMADVAQVFSLAVLGMLVALFLMFRHPLGVMGPVLVILMSVMWVLGSMAMLGADFTLISSVVPIFIAASGLGNAIHLQAIYRQLRLSGVGNRDAIARAAGIAGRAMAFTSLTTMAGMASFAFTSLGSVREMGVYSALGSAYSFLLSLTLVPLALSLHRKVGLGGTKTAVPGVVPRLVSFTHRVVCQVAASRRRSIAIVSVFAVVTMIFALGIANLRVHHEPLSWFPDGHPIRQAFSEYERHIGGSANVALLIDLQGDHRLTEKEAIRRMEELERKISAYRDPNGTTPVTKIASVLDLIRESWRAVHEDKPEYYVVPDTEAGIAAMYTLIESGSGQYLNRFVDAGRSKAVMEIRVQWMDATAYIHLGAFLRKTAHEVFGDYGKVRATGGVFAALSVLGALVRDQVTSFSVAFVLIVLTMFLLLRSFKLSLIAMIPNVIPILWVMGLMGMLGIPLDLNTVLIGSLTMGIVVDDTIHFFDHFLDGYREHRSVSQGLQVAFDQSGPAMVMTTIVMVVTFGLYMTATLRNSQWFGLLVAATAIFGVVCELLMTPALLQLAFGHDDKTAAGLNATGSLEAPEREPLRRASQG